MFVITEQNERAETWERSELVNLAETAGAQIIGEIRQSLEREHAATLIGSGKLQELAELVEQTQANLVICNADLSGSQARNIEEACGVRVIDRTQLILDIFASRATSFEGKAQVELAQLSYLLPRLIGHGVSLSRQGGGIGTRGPGETKLETDRRKIRKAISDLRKVVQTGGARRQEIRRRRARQGVYSVGIVGYTNAGKTTLLSELAKRYGEKAAGEGHNRLFDTLDLTSRRIEFAGRTFVMTDTVGFLRELPHHLINAFRATLEEAVDADVILHIVDHDDAYLEEKMDTVYAVLDKDLHVQAPIVTFFNCKGILDEKGEHHQAIRIDSRSVETIVGSAKSEATWDQLLHVLDRVVGQRIAMHLRVPHDRSDVLAQAYRAGRIGPIVENELYMQFDLEIDSRQAAEFLPFARDQDCEIETQV